MVCAAALALTLTGCGGQAAQSAESAVSASVSAAVSAAAEPLAEACRLYETLSDEDVVLPESSGVSYSGGYVDAMPEGIAMTFADGREDVELVFPGSLSEGLTLEQATNGAASYVPLYTRLVWGGERYSSYTIHAENAVLPALRSGCGGILTLDVTGECRVECGGVSCFDGFDCVILTGSGTLTIDGGAGNLDCTARAGALPIPALILDGPELYSQYVMTAAADGVPAYVQLAGALRAELFSVRSGDLCVAAGDFCAGQIWDSRIDNAVFRGGVSLCGLDGGSAAVGCLVMNGGTACFADPLPADCTVEAGSGLFAAPELAERTVHVYQAEVLDATADGTPLCGLLQMNPEMLTGQTAGSAAPAPYRLGRAAEDVYLSGQLALSGVRAQKLTPWGGAWLELRGENVLDNTAASEPAYTATALLATGDGSLEIVGGAGLFGSDTCRTPCLAVRDGASLYLRSAEEDLCMDAGETGAGIVTVDGGSLTIDGAAWMHNAALTVEDGALTVGGSTYLEQGSVTINGGSVTLSDLAIGQGDIVINGGEVTVSGTLGVDTGSVTVNGGTVTIPGGQDALYAQNGSVQVNGGTVRE
jgi:hypothetical protein